MLSQIWPRNAPHNVDALKIFGIPWLCPQLLFPKNFHGLLFWFTIWMCTQNLKSVALADPKIIGGTQKNWAFPEYAHAPSSQTFLMDFSSDASYECTCQIRSPYSCTRSWVNRGTQKLGRSLAMPTQGDAIGGREWYRSKERWWVPISPS